MNVSKRLSRPKGLLYESKEENELDGVYRIGGNEKGSISTFFRIKRSKMDDPLVG